MQGRQCRGVEGHLWQPHVHLWVFTAPLCSAFCPQRGGSSVGAQRGGSTSSISLIGWLFWVPSAVGVNTDAEEKPLVVGALAACKGILAALESSSVGSMALFLMVFL